MSYGPLLLTRSIIVLHKIYGDLNAGIVVATLGYWRQLNTGTVNCISSAEFVDMGHAPTFSDNLVQIKLAN